MKSNISFKSHIGFSCLYLKFNIEKPKSICKEIQHAKNYNRKQCFKSQHLEYLRCFYNSLRRVSYLGKCDSQTSRWQNGNRTCTKWHGNTGNYGAFLLWAMIFSKINFENYWNRFLFSTKVPCFKKNKTFASKSHRIK